MREKLKAYITTEALVFKNNSKNFLFTENDSYWILDFRKIFLNAQILSLFATFFWDKFEDNYPFQLGCLELGSVPFLTALLLEGEKRGKQVNGFIIRKQRKKTGLGNIIEGQLNNEKIFFIDDTFNSGKTFNHAVKVLEEERKKIDIFYTFVNFCNPDGKEILEKCSIQYLYEFTLNDLGLDSFGNSVDKLKEHRYTPEIYPPYRRIYSGVNANRFLFVPKTTLIREDRYLYVGGEGAKILKISADTGDIQSEFWVSPTIGHKNILSVPKLLEDSIVFGAYDGNFYALNKIDLTLKWFFDEADWIGSSPDYSQELDLIFVGLEHGGASLKGSLVALNSKTGAKYWQVFTDDFIHSSPKYNKNENIVTVGTNDGSILVIDATSGKIKVSCKLDQAVKGGFDYSVDGKIVYFGSHTKSFYALDTSSGKIKFQFSTENFVYSTPLVIGDDIFFSGLDQNFYHLDNSGKLVKSIQTFGRNFTEPICIEKTIIVFGSNDGGVYFYDYKQKRVIFKIQHSERIVSRALYDEVFKTIYIYDFMNQVYAYNIAGYIPSSTRLC